MKENFVFRCVKCRGEVGEGWRCVPCGLSYAEYGYSGRLPWKSIRKGTVLVRGRSIPTVYMTVLSVGDDSAEASVTMAPEGLPSRTISRDDYQQGTWEPATPWKDTL